MNTIMTRAHARQQWRARIETPSRAKACAPMPVTLASNGGRGLKRLDDQYKDLIGRVTLASNGGRGLKPDDGPW